MWSIVNNFKLQQQQKRKILHHATVLRFKQAKQSLKTYKCEIVSTITWKSYFETGSLLSRVYCWELKVNVHAQLMVTLEVT